ncbi:hypothetical protein N8K70_15785 [Microbacterium betulae]|uniref:Alcohol dehydrogenase n=1 Tax=Microbacterium betulae TaxID=2981139 RepID=A0AA97FHL2_9MICO|nr:hypothetical protein [Microbacterium sp. AB]WOF22833.1 hypothetical protein N8K70_15785 [Microbacterium sp. AB]
MQVGFGVAEATLPTQLITMKQVTLVGSLGGTPADAAEVVGLVAAGRFRTATEPIGFDDIDEGLQRLARGETRGIRLVAVFGEKGSDHE